VPRDEPRGPAHRVAGRRPARLREHGPGVARHAGLPVANSETVGRGLAALEAYLYVHDQGATPVIGRDGDTAYLGYEVMAPGIPGADQVTFGALAIGTNILRKLCGSSFRLQAVAIAYRAPADTSLFRSFFAAPVRFGAERNTLVFAARWLAMPIPAADPFLRRMLVERIQHEAASLGEPAADRVRRVMRSLVAGGRFSVASAAAAFGIDRRTLARRLSASGTSFRALLDEARHGEAQRLLRSTAVPMAEIASRLGYSDTATFTRAFRRWAGTSPRQWRTENRSL
jgi:AraC-like DNA-binding protein